MIETIRDITRQDELRKYDLEFLNKPAFGGWRMEEDACRFIGRLCEELKPKRILEFGSGLSTLILAHEVSKGNIEKIYSVDHLKDFSGHPREIIKEKKAAVEFRHFPIRLKSYEGKLFQFYSVPEDFLESIAPLDLVIIDGPPYYYNSREAALYAVYHYMSPKGMVLLDDANRHNRETLYLERWKTHFGGNIDVRIFRDEFKKGLASITMTNIKKPISRFSVKERSGEACKSIWCEILRIARRCLR